jgi:hypothetical protein
VKAAGSRTNSPPSKVPTLRIVSIIAAITIVLGAGLFAWSRLEQFLMRDPRFALNGADGSQETQTLDVTGASHASRRQIESVFGEDSGRSVYLMPMSDRRSTLRTVGWVKDASIARLWPNRVLVRINERTPVAFVELAASKYALIDEDGVLLPPVTDRFAVPVLAGVQPSDSAADRRDRVHSMMRLMRDLDDAASKISEVDVSDADNLKVTQPFDGRMLTLLLGDQHWGARYQNFCAIIPKSSAVCRKQPSSTCGWKIGLR